MRATFPGFAAFLGVALAGASSFAQDLPGDEPRAPRELIPQARFEPGYLGAVTDDRQKTPGVRIVEVVPDGPADQAGLKRDDIITAVGEAQVRAMADFARHITVTPAGQTLELTILRGATADSAGETIRVPVPLGVRPPADARRFPNFGRITQDGAPASDPGQPPAAAPEHPQRIMLGVTTVPLDAETQQRLDTPVARGARVTEVVERSPAQHAGIPLDAVIVGVDNRVVRSPDELAGEITAVGAGREIELAYYVGKRLVRRRVRLDAPEPDAGRRIELLEREVDELKRRIQRLEALLERQDR